MALTGGAALVAARMFAARRLQAAREVEGAKQAKATKIAALQMKADEEEGRRNWLAAEERKGAEGRLSDAFELLSSGEIELSDYRSAVADEEERLWDHAGHDREHPWA